LLYAYRHPSIFPGGWSHYTDISEPVVGFGYGAIIWSNPKTNGANQAHATEENITSSI
jgi:hypothetical protein